MEKIKVSNSIKALREMVAKAAEKCVDADLLDLVYKLLTKG